MRIRDFFASIPVPEGELFVSQFARIHNWKTMLSWGLILFFAGTDNKMMSVKDYLQHVRNENVV